MNLHTDLRVYKLSYMLAVKIHHFSLTLPQKLQFDIADQIRRASRSIPSNIAEGYTRNQSMPDTRFFLSIALGSSAEMLFNLLFLKDTGLMSPEDYKRFAGAYEILGRQLKQLIRSLRAQKSAPRHPLYRSR